MQQESHRGSPCRAPKKSQVVLLRESLIFMLLGMSWVAAALAGTPDLDDNCSTDQGRVVVRYDPAATRYFAEARVVPPEERSEAQRRNVPVLSIVVNPTLYFLGQRTQQWLFLRQCVHIQQRHRIAERGERALLPEDEERADCQALSAMIDRGLGQGSTRGALVLAIESDMERVAGMGRWREVLPGPARRIALGKCPG